MDSRSDEHMTKRAIEAEEALPPEGPVRRRPAAGASELPPKLGGRLKHARLSLGLRLREVAWKAGCSESMVSKIENDRITPSIKTFHKVCGALGVRSEEHTSELQSLMRISYAVFCLKKKNKNEPFTTSRDIDSRN